MGVKTVLLEGKYDKRNPRARHLGRDKGMRGVVTITSCGLGVKRRVGNFMGRSIGRG